MRALARLALALPLLLAPGLLVAASAPVAGGPRAIELDLRRATAEANAAEKEARRLGAAANAAADDAERLRAEQAAAAESIRAAEARISAAEARARIIATHLQARRSRLEQLRAPAGSLLAGLAMMANRPPLLALVDGGSTDDFVRVRILLDSTLPVIRGRTEALVAELEQGRRLEQAALAARAQRVRTRDQLAERRREFAALEQRALRLAERRGAEAVGVGDVALARGEDVAALVREAERQGSAAGFAGRLAAAAPPPARPVRADGEWLRGAFPYRLPAAARVTEGLGAVGASGVRSRGLKLATARGAAIVVPASGIVRFSGPFRSHDGVVIIDHGKGWMSLLLNVASPLDPGARVRIGQSLGRALGPIGVELSHNGVEVSPALSAGSSETLSNGDEHG